MFDGGKKSILIQNKFIGYVGILIPVIMVFYIGLIKYEIVFPIHSVNNSCLILFGVWWIIVALIQAFSVPKSRLDYGLRLLAYHILTAVCLVFVSGVPSPIAIVWLIYMILSYVFYANNGLLSSIGIFFATVVLDIFIWQDSNNNAIIYDLIALIIILAVGVLTFGILSLNANDNKKASNDKTIEKIYSTQNSRTYAIINNMTDAVISINLDGLINIYNASSLNLLDTNDDITQRHIDDILNLTNEKNETISLYKELKNISKAIKRDDLYYNYDDGEKIRLEITYTPIRTSFDKTKRQDEKQGYIIIFKDVTKEKSLEEERDEFISVTSHELRTPITIAEGTISNVQVMLDHPNVTPKMLKDAVDMAHEQIVFLAHMVNDLSTLSRAERGVSDSKEDVNVSELANRIHGKYLPEANAKKIRLDLDLSPELGIVHVSKLYIEELLQNFMTNALKYTKSGTITICFTKQNNTINFAIKDTGIGLSKPEQTKIFNKFYRSEDYRTRETSGTGLGLYVACKLAKKIGTKINLVSRLNHGSTFSFDLPAIEKTDTP